MVNDYILEILKVSIDLVCISKQLSEIDDGAGADFSEVLSDLKWNRMSLHNGLLSLKGGE